MNRAELIEVFEEFLKLTDRQQAIREELLALQMGGSLATEEEVTLQVQQHQELIDEIDRIRMQMMVPILERLVAFIASAQANGVSS